MKTIYAEILTIGDEILYGQIIDTNSQYLSRELDALGIKVRRKSAVGDEEQAILRALAEAESRADLVLMTGGLGPTKDDITKKTLAQYFETEMRSHPETLAFIVDFFQKRGREIKDIHRRQALMPAAAQILPNRLGTAPAMWFEKNGKVFVSMPGVPQEMEILMQEAVIPKIKTFFQTPVIYHKVIKTFGAGETMLSELIEDWEDHLPPHIRLAYLPSWGEVKLRLTATGPSRAELEAQVAAEIEKVMPRIEKYVYGYDQDELEAKVGEWLLAQGKTVATAESCTGGFIGHLFTKVPGSSRYFTGGVIAYSNEVKMQQLGVKPETLAQHGAVSEETACQMAEGVRQLLQTSIGVASTGVAGPEGGSPEKPVGTVWIAYADGQQTQARKLSLTNDRLLNIRLTAYIVLDMIRKRLREA
ncbi:MAG: competence/damage-inducible protein A [Microscillaceae bacterium]|nr:competence/damage-inducible protein A [Microscillaceae bacterium]